jgi:hypothetical protein
MQLVELPPPPGMPPPSDARSDAALARALAMTENNVRVHRTQAKRRLYREDPAAGRLLEALLDHHFHAMQRP